MGRDLKVRFFQSKEEYNDGDYNYGDHEDDFSLNGKRNTPLPWDWRGSYFALINYIAEEAKELQKSCINDEDSSDDNENSSAGDDRYDNGYTKTHRGLDYDGIQEQAELIGYLGLILSECSSGDYIVIRND